MRILLVDDNPLMQQVISRFLESQGYHVAVAEDGAEAMTLAKGEAFQLFVLDMRLPDLDGPQILTALRGLPGMERSPAIAVSGLGEEDRERTVKAGFDMFLAKPVDLDELLLVVRHLFERSTARAVGK
jgi:DNA-binding response OmpR family regulator